MEIESLNMDGFTIYCKSNCKLCVYAKELLDEKSYFYKSVCCDEYLETNKALFLNTIKPLCGDRNHTTFPFIFFKNSFIGGFKELHSYIENKDIFLFNNDF